MLRSTIVINHSKAVVQRCSVKKVFLKISINSQENPCARDSFLIKLQASSLPFYWKRDWRRCFSDNIAKIRRTLFFIEHLWWLLLISQGELIFANSANIMPMSSKICQITLVKKIISSLMENFISLCKQEV